MESTEIDFKNWRTFERTGWENQMRDNGNSFVRLTRRAIEPLLDAAQVMVNSQVLDIATGAGHVAASAVARGAMAIGIDSSESRIEGAWWRYPGIQFRAGDPNLLPFSNEGFNSVVSNFGLDNIADAEKAIAEIYRVLRTDGRIALTTWNKRNGEVGFDQVKHLAPATSTRQNWLEKTLTDAGFIDINWSVLNLIWHVESLDELLDCPILSDEVRFNQKDRIVQSIKPYKHLLGYELPMSAVLISAVK